MKSTQHYRVVRENFGEFGKPPIVRLDMRPYPCRIRAHLKAKQRLDRRTCMCRLGPFGGSQSFPKPSQTRQVSIHIELISYII